MDWKDVGQAVKKYAPVLGSVIGGPTGGAIGSAISMVAGAFGIEDEQPTPEQIYQAVQADPEASIKLRKIELDHKVELQKLALEADRMRIADIANARAREQAVVKATGKKDINLYLLAWVVVSGFFGLVALMIFRPLPENSSQVIFMLFGGLVSGFTAVLQYFFGSSKSSADKTKLISSKK